VGRREEKRMGRLGEMLDALFVLKGKFQDRRPHEIHIVYLPGASSPRLISSNIGSATHTKRNHRMISGGY
jgi:hypothetical protein